MKESQTDAWPQISESELEVMKVLWQFQRPLSSGEIIEALTAKTLWKPKTIQTMLNRLVAKGAVAADKNSGKAYAYQALVAEDLRNILEDHGLKGKNIRVAKAEKPLAITDVFPGLFEGKRSVNVKV